MRGPETLEGLLPRPSLLTCNRRSLSCSVDAPVTVAARSADEKSEWGFASQLRFTATRPI